ncbi:hypothetical protein [Pontibacter harenae]|uniref:hypothetical protein n=1 Tax=Pontibacter harenae TaxID=2894083 RepID=UPI001E64AFEE|nr:hypothetical protein [Pontibacter harenae]MCC9167672.1 hypothetical protein [Pontibacter harenae]
MFKHLLLQLLFLGTVQLAQAQTVTLSKLEVRSKEVYMIGSENSLNVDTLILHDNATIQFDPEKHGTMEAKAVYVGENCKITSKGGKGLNVKGINLTDGYTDYVLSRLGDGSLTGANAVGILKPGGKGQPGMSGSDASIGGSGGNGGNVTLCYKTNGFLPIIQ